MMNLYDYWKCLSEEMRKLAAVCDNDTARNALLTRAQAIDTCAAELLSAYLKGE